jgi:hypothetical protein
MNQNFYGNNKRKLHSLFLWIFLFILAMFIPPVVAEVSSPPAMVQTESPLNSPSMGNLQSSSPQNWGAGGQKPESSLLRFKSSLENLVF